MKHPLSGRKHLLTFVLAAAFALGAAVPVVATNNSRLDGIYTNNRQTIDVRAVCDAPTYSVALTWGSMEFHYQYGKGWDYSSDTTFNKITVQNESAIPVAVRLDFDGNGGHQGSFNTKNDGKGTNYKALYLSESSQDSFPTGEVYLILNEKRLSNPDGENVGSITLTLTEVVQDDAQALVSALGDANIGYVTSDSQLIPYTEKNLNN